MYKILIADDEKKIRETLSDYLVSKDFEVILAKDGEGGMILEVSIEKCIL